MMRWFRGPSRCVLMAGAALALAAQQGAPQTVRPHADPAGVHGARPYEMVWANRTRPNDEAARFDDLTGWTVRVSGGAEAEWQPSTTQDLWGRPVGRLRYRASAGSTGQPRITLVPPQPFRVPIGSDSAELWVHGNRWSFANDPATPEARVSLQLQLANGSIRTLGLAGIGWMEWWLVHRRFAPFPDPAACTGIEIEGGTQPEWRELYFESLRFFKEPLPPLSFEPRPRRNLKLLNGQSPGANTGPGRLPFPTREETICPETAPGQIRRRVAAEPGGYRFEAAWSQGTVAYHFDPSKGLAGIRAQLDGKPVGVLTADAAVTFGDRERGWRLIGCATGPGSVIARYAHGGGAGTGRLELRILGKSLVVDVSDTSGLATGVDLGRATELSAPRAVRIPYITFGSGNPGVLMCRAGRKTVFLSAWVDWYRSNGSELYGDVSAGASEGRMNGGVRYIARTDGKRNPLFERLFLTVSPAFEEVLPSLANPVGLHAAMAKDRLWQESWGPDVYADEKRRSERLARYGITKLIQCNHEIEWRDGGESFTVRLHAAPKRGGDEALRDYVGHQERLGWFAGLYTNYTDFAPVNGFWTPDRVQREPDGDWRRAWARCYALKPLAAVELEADLAPKLKARYGSNAGYTDVHTAVAPWAYNDYDARVPGAGTFAQTFYAYGELLRNDSRVFGGPIFSEGTYQWLYAGLTDGNYGLAYNGRPLVTEALLPIYDLLQIHPRECDIGMPWTSAFMEGIPGWQAPEAIDHALDRLMLHTLAYGHLGWLVEDQYGMPRVCRSYYMLQQVQARYGLQRPSRIAYWDGQRLVSVSDALARDLPASRRQLYVAYPNGLRLWLNDHPAEVWTVHAGSRAITLPPAGWAAYQPPGADRRGGMLSWSALIDGRKADCLLSDACAFLDGRGEWLDTAAGASDGSLAMMPDGRGGLTVIRASGTGRFLVRRPFGVRGRLKACAAADADGKPVQIPMPADNGSETWIAAPEGAVRFALAFDGVASAPRGPARSAAPPGARVAWTSGKGTAVTVPDDARVGVFIKGPGQVGVRVKPPVVWRWTKASGEPAIVRVRPQWDLSGVGRSAVRVTVAPPPGWDCRPDTVQVDPVRPPREVVFTLESHAPAGTAGTMTIAVQGVPGAQPLRLAVKRVAAGPVSLESFRHPPETWGVSKRGQDETTLTEGSGAVCFADTHMVVGGVARAGLFMHPPYNGGTGYTWALTQPISLPAGRCAFHAWVGLRDGGDASDGVVFRVIVVDDAGNQHTTGEMLGLQRGWRELTADLSAFGGKRVRIKLVADAGPKDDPTADWGCWGDPQVTQVRTGEITTVEAAH